MPEVPRVVHVVNQFFGGLGGEEAAGIRPRFLAGARGPGLLWEKLAGDLKIAGTIVVGDNFAAGNADAAAEEVLALIEEHVSGGPCLLVAGPAFLAGRYGMTCGAVCKAAAARWGIPAVTAMSRGNPAVAEYRKSVVIVETSGDVLGMSEALERMVRVSRHLLDGGDILPERDGTLAHGRRDNFLAEETGAMRAIAMLMRKLNGEPFVTEYAMPAFDRVAPAPPVEACGSIRLALVTSGGIVPRGNPDRIESASASRFGEYGIAGVDALTPRDYQTVHGGYDPTHANADPNRVLPLDVARELEKEGRIGTLHDRYYATVGNATSVERAREFGLQIAGRLLADGVQAVILTST